MKNVMIIGLFSLLAACAPMVVKTKPAEPVVVVPAPPGPGYVWVDGAWRWDRRAHAHRYVNGYWARPVRPGATYVRGGWRETRRGWRYTPGHWR